MPDLQKPIFHDETKAREWLESQVWPDGPFCPHCGSEEGRKGSPIRRLLWFFFLIKIAMTKFRRPPADA